MRVAKVFILITCLFLFSCDNKKQEEQIIPNNKDFSKLHSSELETDVSGLSHLKAVIKTVHGNIILKFYPKHAPNTVTRIMQLIQNGFYDGQSFHRVTPNYVIQTGDPTGTGKGGSGFKLKAEFNKIQHIKGTVGMARFNDDVDSADSQFYIALTTLPHLNEKYTIFGQVVDGINVLDKIKKGNKILSISLQKNQ